MSGQEPVPGPGELTGGTGVERSREMLPEYREPPVERGGSLAPDGFVREQLLVGGRAGGVVVRSGRTVRRQVVPNTAFAHEVLTWFAGCGMDRVPRSLGVDESGRWVLSFLAGRQVALSEVDREVAARFGMLLAEIHAAGAAHVSRASSEVPWWVRTGPDTRPAEPGDRWGPVGVVHGDAGVWNVVVEAGSVGLVDWECCHVGRWWWELALAAVSLVDPGEMERSVTLVRSLVDGYGLDGAGRAGFGELVVARATSAVAVIAQGAQAGEEPWASMAVDGTGAWWESVRLSCEEVAGELGGPGR